MKVMPSVQKFMTYLVKTIDVHQNVSHANDLMRRLHLRFLPIVKAGALVGVLTDKEVHMILSLKEHDTSNMKIEDFYSNDFLNFSPEALMDEVLIKMIEKRACCAIVSEKEKLIGVFTETDAYKQLLNLLRSDIS